MSLPSTLIRRVKLRWGSRECIWGVRIVGDTELKNSKVALAVKNPCANAGKERDVGLIPGSGISPGGGCGIPLQYSSLEIPWTEEPSGLQSMGSHRVKHN